MLFKIGYLASNGKSLLKQMFINSYSIYADTLSSDTFKAAATNTHKFLADLDHLRSAWIEELPKDRLDTNSLKAVVSEKNIKIAKLYSTTSKLLLTCKLTIVSNFDPCLDIDNGIVRRAMVMRYHNKFLKKQEYADAEAAGNTGKGVYHANLHLNKIIERSDFKLAFFHLMEKHLKIFNKHGLNDMTQYSKNFKQVADENDHVAYFIKTNYNITGDLQDRVSKDMFYSLYKRLNNRAPLWNSLLSDIKRIDGITYKALGSIGGVRGVICGLKRRMNASESIDVVESDDEEKVEDLPKPKKSHHKKVDDKIASDRMRSDNFVVIEKEDVDEEADAYDSGVTKLNLKASDEEIEKNKNDDLNEARDALTSDKEDDKIVIEDPYIIHKTKHDCVITL
jgi:hypothetical protein